MFCISVRFNFFILQTSSLWLEHGHYESGSKILIEICLANTFYMNLFMA